jgi:DNA-binding NarL/FixJ family response regulator
MVVLIVEDEAISAIGLALELEAAGHIVIGPAATHAGAILLARAERPALALVDIDLQQNENGIDIARTLQQLGVPSVFLTAQPDEARANADAAVGLIQKPCDLDAVSRSLQIVMDVLDGRAPPAHTSPLELFGRSHGHGCREIEQAIG